VNLQDNKSTAPDRLELFKGALDSASHAVCIARIEGGEVMYANPAFCRLTGYAEEELKKAGLAAIFAQASSPDTIRNLMELLRQGRTWRGEICFVPHGGGAPAASHFVVSPFNPEERLSPGHGMDTARYLCAIQMKLAGGSIMPEDQALFREQLEKETRRRMAEQTQLYQVSAALHTSLDLEETLQLVLVAATAGEGYRFNRAFVFLRDPQDSSILAGRYAVGPFPVGEAERIWQEMADMPREERLSDLLRRYSDNLASNEQALTQFTRSMKISLDRCSCALGRALRERRAIVAESAEVFSCESCRQIPWSGRSGDPVAIVPLICRGNLQGCLLADNAITHQPIHPDELQTLELFADHAAEAIANAMLYEQAQQLVAERDRALDDLRTNQENLVQAQKMAALGRMAAAVVHELKTPLIIIGGYTRSLLARPFEPSRMAADLEVIRDEVTRLENVIESLLFYARPKKPVFQPADLNAEIEGVIQYLKRSADEARVDISFSRDSAIPEMPMDRLQMRLVFMNLIMNAIQAMPGGGHLEISTQRGEGECIVRVADTGIGIAPDCLDRIFEAFYTTKPKGTGLGLFVAQHIVSSHEGRICVASSPQNGTEFSVYLPMSLPAEGRPGQ